MAGVLIEQIELTAELLQFALLRIVGPASCCWVVLWRYRNSQFVGRVASFVLLNNIVGKGAPSFCGVTAVYRRAGDALTSPINN